MSTQPGVNARYILIQLTANFNLVLGGLAVAFGVYVLFAGADAMATMMQAGDAGAEAVGKVAPGADAKKVSDIMELATKGVGAVFMAMASIVAGCAIVQGLPLLLVGLGILYRQGWARIFGILFGILGLLQGLACLGGSGSSRAVLINGAIFTAYGLLSLIALIGSGASAYFARRDLQPGPDGKPLSAPGSGWALGGIGVSAALVLAACGLAYTNLPRGAGPSLPGVADKQMEKKLFAIWETGDPNAHRLGFAKNGVLYYGTREGGSKGTYKLSGADTLEFEYVLPDAIYQAQKAVFDLAKKAADNPDNPFKGLFNAIEPVRVIKDRVTFTLANGDECLMLHRAKGPIRYMLRERTTDDKQFEEVATYEDFRKKERDKDKAVAAKDGPMIAPFDIVKKVDPKIDPIDPIGAGAAYSKRLAELHDAIAKGQSSRVREIMQRFPTIVNDRDGEGETPLMKAVQAGYYDVFKELATLGADWTITDSKGNNLFMYALAIGRFEWLFSQMENVPGKPSVRMWPGPGPGLTYVNVNVLALVSRPNPSSGANGIALAAKNGHLSDLKFIHGYIEPGQLQIYSHKDNEGKTALDHARSNKDNNGVVAWLQSVMTQDSTLPKTKAANDWKVSTDPALVAFLKACEKGDLDGVDAILKAANVGQDSDGKSKLLLQARDAVGRTPLMLAAACADATLVLVLQKRIRELPDWKCLSATDGKGRTAIHHAAAKGDVEVLGHLLEGLMAAWQVYDRSSIQWFRVLNTADDSGKNALELAEAGGHKQVAEKIKAHQDAHFQTTMYSSQHTVLEWACHDGDVASVRKLIKAGCPLLRPKFDYSKDTLKTPLMHASYNGHIAVVKVLLDSFGDDTERKLAYINLRSGGGTALTSTGSSQPEVAALLKKHGAK